MSSFRIKISSKIIAFIILEILLFILGNKTNLGIFFFLFLLAIVFFCLDSIWLVFSFLTIGRIEIIRKSLDDVVEGDFLPVELLFRNLNFSPVVNIEISDFLEPAKLNKQKKFFIPSVKPKGQLSFKYGCICFKRGKYVLGPVFLRSFGFLGFLYTERFIGSLKNVYVYPRTFNIEAAPFLVSGPLPWFGLQTVSAGGGEDEFFGLREYKPGDPLKRIHWFSAARKNTLIVKEFQRCSFHQATIMFLLNKEQNIGRSPETVCELTIKIAASLTKHFIENDICIEVLAHAGRIAYFSLNKGKEYLDEIFKFYAEAQPESHLTLEEFFQEYSTFIPSHSTLFILLTENEVDNLLSILQLKERNISIVALVLMSSTFSSGRFSRQDTESKKSNILAQFANSNIRVLFFSKSDNLSEVFSQIK